MSGRLPDWQGGGKRGGKGEGRGKRGTYGRRLVMGRDNRSLPPCCCTARLPERDRLGGWCWTSRRGRETRREASGWEEGENGGEEGMLKGGRVGSSQAAEGREDGRFRTESAQMEEERLQMNQISFELVQRWLLSLEGRPIDILGHTRGVALQTPILVPAPLVSPCPPPPLTLRMSSTTRVWSTRGASTVSRSLRRSGCSWK